MLIKTFFIFVCLVCKLLVVGNIRCWRTHRMSLNMLSDDFHIFYKMQSFCGKRLHYVSAFNTENGDGA